MHGLVKGLSGNLDNNSQLIGIKNCSDLVTVSRYFQNAQYPFPKNENATISNVQAVAIATAVAPHIKGLWAAFGALRSAEEFKDNAVVEAINAVIDETLALKELAPTTFQAICSVVPLDRIKLPPHLRKMLEQSLSLVLGQTVSFYDVQLSRSLEFTHPKISNWVGLAKVASDRIREVGGWIQGFEDEFAKHNGLSKSDPAYAVKLHVAKTRESSGMQASVLFDFELTKLEKWKSLVTGSSYLQGVRHPFPTDGDISAHNIRAVSIAMAAAQHWNDLYAAYRALRSPELKDGAAAIEAATAFVERAAELKKFAPTTTIKAIRDRALGFDRIVLPPPLRKLLGQSLSLVFNEPVVIGAEMAPAHDPTRPASAVPASAPSIKRGLAKD